MIAVAIFLVAGSDDEPIGGDPDDGAARARARDRRRLHDRDVDGGRRRAASSRRTARRSPRPRPTRRARPRLGKRVVDHSFQLPLQIAWIVTALVGIVIVWLFFGDQTPAPPRPRRRAVSLSVRGAAFLGIGAMVGAGIFALLGEAGVVAGSAVWLSFLLAGIVAALLGYIVVKLGVRYPSSGGLIAYLIAGLRQRSPGRHRLVARLLRRDRDRLLDGGGRPSAATRPRSSSATTPARPGTTSSRRSSSIAMAAINIVGSRFVDRAQSLIVIVLLGGLRRLHRRDDRRHRLGPARVQRLSVLRRTSSRASR